MKHICIYRGFKIINFDVRNRWKSILLLKLALDNYGSVTKKKDNYGEKISKIWVANSTIFQSKYNVSYNDMCYFGSTFCFQLVDYFQHNWIHIIYFFFSWSIVKVQPLNQRFNKPIAHSLRGKNSYKMEIFPELRSLTLKG